MIRWYEESFGREYLELYAHRDLAEARESIRAIVQLISPPKDGPLLDLCCGAGRHLLVLREIGFSQLVGLDLSQELLQAAATSLADSGTEHVKLVESREARKTEPNSSRMALVRADMRHIPYEDYFATILSIFTSFGYFEEDEENQAVLKAVYRALRPGGTFLIDYLNRDYVISHLVARDEKRLPGRHVYNVRCLADGSHRVEKTTTVIARDGSKRQFFESVRMYSEPEMGEMLRAEGFMNIRAYGSLSGQAFGPESERLLIVAERGADS